MYNTLSKKMLGGKKIKKTLPLALLDNYFDIPCSLELVVSRSSGDIKYCEEKNCQTQNERGQVSGKSDLSENPRNTMHHIKCRKKPP